ncbi:ThiJ/PfpI family protein [Aspergillus luchuensis]|uniref:ThiJ/PfpI family protein n=1 Tax=Aspergillus kawachii TaxID=1069201 RepID=A0A146F7Y7_ASPKA|nr:ThiJ/PfpI family protein [Aspergillus luchuensis]
MSPVRRALVAITSAHAPLYPEGKETDTKGLQAITSKIFTSGGIVSAVCHGGAIFPCVIDPSTNKTIIDSRRVTGFTTRSEEDENVLDTIKS